MRSTIPANWPRYRLIWPHLRPLAPCGPRRAVRQLLIDQVRYLRQRGDLERGRRRGAEIESAWEEMLAAGPDQAAGRARCGNSCSGCASTWRTSPRPGGIQSVPGDGRGRAERAAGPARRGASACADDGRAAWPRTSGTRAVSPGARRWTERPTGPGPSNTATTTRGPYPRRTTSPCRSG